MLSTNSLDVSPVKLENSSRLVQDEAGKTRQDESISISQVIGLCCRYIKSAIESHDHAFRVKRLGDITRELTTTRKFKALQDSAHPAWECLKSMVDTLAASEDGADSVLITTTKEEAYELAIKLATELSQFSLERDYFFESMILDINSLHSTLGSIRNGYMKLRHRNELLKMMSKAQTAAEIELSIREAFSINASLEVDAARNMIFLCNRIDSTRIEKLAVEGKLRDATSLVENQQAQIREGEMQIAQGAEVILDLKRKLAQAKAERKAALDEVAEVASKIENERKMLRSVKDSLSNLSKQNEDLEDALKRAREQLKEADELRKELFQLERDLESSRAAQVLAEQERDRAVRIAEEERDTRRRCDAHLMESEAAGKRLAEELAEGRQRLEHAESQLRGLESDLAHERDWRREWDACHAQASLPRLPTNQ
jgi:DNA repair exonuclease SbcCD ATPase subunit